MRAILCFFVIACFGLSACVPVSMVPNSSGTRPTIASNTGPKSPTGQFAQIVNRVEPVAEDFCLTMRQNLNCDFLVIVDDRNTKTVNAFQTQSRDGRPLVIFTQGLINKAQNADELAFVLGHEMAHHLEGHLTRQYESARAGAILLGGLTVMSGGPKMQSILPNNWVPNLVLADIQRTLNSKPTALALYWRCGRDMILCAVPASLVACPIQVISF